ncbi:MAG: ATP-binding protein [Deltaproteobacteria bacterium]|nr:MAG: ATP-binding protein [Deltaproteobacteria bacterium]
MEKYKLRELIIEHKERFLLKGGLIRREVQDDIARYLEHKEIILITGVRRGGKSSLMKLICDDIISGFNVPSSNILYLNFEDERFVDFSVKDFEPLYEIFIEVENPKGRKYFFLDEVQNIRGWEKWVNRLYEFEDIKIFVTGSNAALLSSEISTALTGRNRQVVNWPFSFREFLALRGYVPEEKSFYIRERRVEVRRLFREYFELGGFPEVLKINDTTLLEQYFKDIIYRDVIARYSIRNIKEIKELTLFLASNIGTIQSYKNLKELIGVKSLNTVKNYLEALSDVFLFFCIDFFAYSIKRQIYNPSKVYCVDAGLSSSISFKFSKNLGHLYENLVYIELKRRNKEVYYWKSKKGREIDFVIKRGPKIEEAIQVSISLVDKMVKEREIRALMEAKEELNPPNLVILTEDEEGQETIGDVEINIFPLWKWLILGGKK